MAEFFYVFYLLSGLFDGWLAVNGINIGVDLGVITSIILLFILGYNLLVFNKVYFTRHFIDSFLILLLIFVFAIVSLIYTPSTHYAYIKILYFLKEIILTFSFPFIIRKFDLKRFIKYLVVLTFSYSIVYLYDVNIRLHYRPDNVYRSFFSQYLYIGITNGLVFLLMIFSKDKIYKNETLQFLVALLALSFLIISAARGPAIFLAIILIFSFFKTLYVRLNRKWLVLLFLFSLVIVPTFIYFLFTNPKLVTIINTLLERTMIRFSKLIAFFTGKGQDVSAEDRVDMLYFAFNGIFKSIKQILLGNGIGSFGILYLGKDVRWYPHNVFLEIWFELGIFPFLLFVLLFIKVFATPRQNPFISSYVILYILLNILKSYSFADMRVAYMFLALYLLPWPMPRKTDKPVSIDSTPDSQ